MSNPSVAARIVVGQAKPERVAATLEQEIRSGKLAFGQRLQSENELVRRFAVSRTTVRKGLESLAGKGLITTRSGIGSFVTFDGKTIDNALGWTRALAGSGRLIETKVLRLAQVKDTRLALSLDIPSNVFTAIDRTRSIAASGQVVSLERSRVPLRRELPDLHRTGLLDGSLSRTLAAAGLHVVSGEEWVDAGLLNSTDAALMAKPKGAPCLRTRRIARAADGSVIEHVVSLLDPAHFALYMEF